MLTCYEFGMLRSLLLEKVAPKQFHDKEMEGLRTFYPGDMGEDMLERMVFKPWLELSMVETSRVVHQSSLGLQSPSPVPFVATSDCSSEGLLDVSKHERMRRASGIRLLDS